VGWMRLHMQPAPVSEGALPLLLLGFEEVSGATNGMLGAEEASSGGTCARAVQGQSSQDLDGSMRKGLDALAAISRHYAPAMPYQIHCSGQEELRHVLDQCSKSGSAASEEKAGAKASAARFDCSSSLAPHMCRLSLNAALNGTDGGGE